MAEERRVLEPLERALDIYERLGNKAQEAAVHYQMGSFFSRIWMGQADKCVSSHDSAPFLPYCGLCVIH